MTKLNSATFPSNSFVALFDSDSGLFLSFAFPQLVLIFDDSVGFVFENVYLCGFLLRSF